MRIASWWWGSWYADLFTYLFAYMTKALHLASLEPPFFPTFQAIQMGRWNVCNWNVYCLPIYPHLSHFPLEVSGLCSGILCAYVRGNFLRTPNNPEYSYPAYFGFIWLRWHAPLFFLRRSCRCLQRPLVLQFYYHWTGLCSSHNRPVELVSFHRHRGRNNPEKHKPVSCLYFLQ